MKKNYLILVFVISSFLSVNKVSAQDVPILGQITIFAGNFAPRGWALCNGQLLSIQQNTALFSILGTTYGGDGRTTFGLPDLRNRVPVGQGVAQNGETKELGEVGGSTSTTILISNMPAHSHQLVGTTLAGNTNVPQNALHADTSVLDKEYTTDTSGAKVNMSPLAIGITGGSQPINIQQPYLGVNYIIATEGVFPQRP
ncbi:microcystin-dependent protein [Flavobacterium cutihirudinis]|uniref:Microcystin-dependent protein n=1 Tax=Flavobacterium cutihirudinis TaxID=1265740 RepID=A0A3D9FSQ5_9FLAO|nr:tail fiber protein [Flavobacterium cutihirudinis]RED23663.1 microcystin-dependent protein [Flavobacterium cutihirudinis]